MTRTVPSWGTSGINSRALTQTITDSSSPTGTVASAVFNSFAVPTINATNASVVYTNLANVYISGDVATTGNASATNSYGLWNAGKTRLDGTVRLGSSSGTTLTDTFGAFSLTGGAGNMTIIGGTGASRTVTIQTTTSGSAATTALALDATQGATFANNITLQGTAIITKPGGTIPIFTTNTAITDNAGAGLGTLTNAPSAGNPTKWVRFNDNGTVRSFPAW